MDKLTSLLSSPLVEQLKDGKLPEVEVGVNFKIEAYLLIFLTAVAIMLAAKILKRF